MSQDKECQDSKGGLPSLPSWCNEIPTSSNDVPMMRHCSEDSFSSNISNSSLSLSGSYHSQEHSFDCCQYPQHSQCESGNSCASSNSCNSIIDNLPLHEVPELDETENDAQSSSGTPSSIPLIRRLDLNKEDDRVRKWSGDIGLSTWLEPSDFSSSDTSATSTSSADPSSIPTSSSTNNLCHTVVQDDAARYRQVFHASSRRERNTFSLAVLIFCALSFTYCYSSQRTLGDNLKNSRDLLVYTQQLGLQLKIALKDVKLMQMELATLDGADPTAVSTTSPKKAPSSEALTKAFANPALMREMVTVQRSLRRSQYQAEHLKELVKETSKADALSTYGDGIIKVRIELAFPEDDHFLGVGHSHANMEPTAFVIEMAPIDLMPHSVYTFLEMASAGLLDGCSFILNAMHVLKAAPLPYDGTPPSVKAKEFLDKGLESVAFREYSPEYPHTKYTVGFAADGSPSFYINTEDNSEIHAGDPCVARVVSGFETIHRLEQSPTRNGLWLDRRVGIKSARVL